jgi:hypothetical protein
LFCVRVRVKLGSSFRGWRAGYICEDAGWRAGRTALVASPRSASTPILLPSSSFSPEYYKVNRSLGELPVLKSITYKHVILRILLLRLGLAVQSSARFAVTPQGKPPRHSSGIGLNERIPILPSGRKQSVVRDLDPIL